MLATFPATCGDYFGHFTLHIFLLYRVGLDCIGDVLRNLELGRVLLYLKFEFLYCFMS